MIENESTDERECVNKNESCVDKKYSTKFDQRIH